MTATGASNSSAATARPPRLPQPPGTPAPPPPHPRSRPRPTAPRCASARCARPPAGSPSRSRTDGSPVPAATVTTSSAKASSAPRAPPSANSTRTPTGCAPPGARRGRQAERGELGGGVRARSPPGSVGSLADGVPDAVAVVPRQSQRAHHGRSALPARMLVGVLRTRNVFTASTLDQMPKHVSSGLLYGDPHAIPVPDLDRTDHLLLLGANPLDSNGSLCHRPRLPRQAQGAAPPRRHAHRRSTRAAPVRPSSPTGMSRSGPAATPSCSMAMVQVLFAEGLTDTGALGPHLTGVEEVRALAAEFTPEAVAEACDVTGRRHPRAGPRGGRGTGRPPSTDGSAAPPSSSAPSPTGWSTSSTCSPATSTARRRHVPALGHGAATHAKPRSAEGKGFALGRWHSRVSGHPEAKSGTPAVALAEEIEHPGRGPRPGTDHPRRQPGALRTRRRTARTGAGRTGLHGQRRPVSQRDLPPRRRRAAARPRPAAAAHFDFAFNALRRTQPGPLHPRRRPPAEGELAESEILARLVLCAGGMHERGPGQPWTRRSSASLLGKAVADSRTRPCTARTRRTWPSG